MFGQEKLQEIFLKKGGCATEEIKKEILAALEDYACNDDITMMVLKRLR